MGTNLMETTPHGEGIPGTNAAPHPRPREVAKAPLRYFGYHCRMNWISVGESFRFQPTWMLARPFGIG